MYFSLNHASNNFQTKYSLSDNNENYESEADFTSSNNEDYLHAEKEQISDSDQDSVEEDTDNTEQVSKKRIHGKVNLRVKKVLNVIQAQQYQVKKKINIFFIKCLQKKTAL